MPELFKVISERMKEEIFIWPYTYRLMVDGKTFNLQIIIKVKQPEQPILIGYENTLEGYIHLRPFLRSGFNRSEQIIGVEAVFQTTDSSLVIPLCEIKENGWAQPPYLNPKKPLTLKKTFAADKKIQRFAKMVIEKKKSELN